MLIGVATRRPRLHIALSLVLVFSLASAVGGLGVGYLADRFGAKPVLIWNFVAFALVAIVAAVAVSLVPKKPATLG